MVVYLLPALINYLYLLSFYLIFRYENDNPSMRFTENQLAEIRKITISKVLCENMDHRGEIQRSALDQPSGFL